MAIMQYPERESKVIEFKEKIPKFDKLIKTCVAFANGAGGQIIIGVEDNTRNIVGISDEMRDKIYEGFQNSLYDSTQPKLIASIYEKNFGDQSVLIIEIPLVIKKPCFIKSEGIPKGVYLRIGPHTKRANQHYIEELLREAKNTYFDGEAILNLQSAELDKELINQYYGMSVSNKRLLNDNVISQSATHTNTYYPTVAGLLTFHNHPEKYLPESLIILTQYGDDKSRDIIRTEEITGSILQQMNISLGLLKTWLQQNFVLQHAKLKGELLVPEAALREAIINALIHRKYSIPGAIKIAVYPNRLEIFSPGNFPGFVDIDNLGDGTTFLRNPTLARLARTQGLIEKLGSGVKLIFHSTQTAGLKKPVYNEDGDFVKITFYFDKVKQNNETDEEALLNFVKNSGAITIPETMQLLGMSRNTASRRLSSLVKTKKLLRIGKGPSVKYISS